MNHSKKVIFSWSFLLGLALVAPTALPAGGGERYLPAIRRRQVNEPLIAQEGFNVFVSPLSAAPTLRKAKQGTPLKILRTWRSSDGSKWLYVQYFAMQNNLLSETPIRGWLNA